MYNMLISLLVCLLTAGLLVLAGIPLWGASLAGILLFTVTFLLLARFTFKKVGALLETAQKDLQAGRVEKAVKTLESGYKYAPWQFYIRQQLDAQIGTILYLKRDFAAAFEYLQKALVRHWVAMGMLGVCYMKRNKPGKMIETFDKATAATRKEPLLWNLYAYCLERVGEKDKAIAVMEKGLKRTKGDERLQGNLEALREGRKMKMKVYGDLWLQFHLEKPGELVKQQTRAIQGRRKIVRR
jgi:tetratricopeptide (TPR) repeat protein